MKTRAVLGDGSPPPTTGVRLSEVSPRKILEILCGANWGIREHIALCFDYTNKKVDVFFGGHSVG